METNLYFGSIVLMCGVTGWLAVYAWRQRSVPGAHAYAVLALCECFLALTEILSMLSGGPGPALFWFDARFLFMSTIPVLFLVFALQYNGQKSWLSRPLMAAAFIIPALTQIVLWSDALPGLWVKQEVSFYQSGLFWVSDTSARIPGLWFLVHSFYSLLLLLVGIGVILATAWRRPRALRGQALLLSGGALIALVTTLFPTFGLLPPGGFNPFIPGVGASALLYALAIFRFQFLKRSPAADKPQAPSLKAKGNRSLALFSLIFLLLVTAISAIGHLSYTSYAENFRTQVESQLASIGALKATALQDWRTERLADAEALHKNPAFNALAQRYLENPADAPTKAELVAWLKIYSDNSQYDRVFLLDAGGVELISSPAASEPADAHLLQDESAVLRAGQVAFLDFHRDAPDGPIRLALLAPILAAQDNILAAQDNHPLGLLVLRIDPQAYLYPFIQQWPVPSASAETLLVRRDGEDVFFLNTLRFQADAALNLRRPLANAQSPAVMAALGQTGIVEGIDYRGVPVIADVRPVPGSPWFLVSKIDTAEVYAPLQQRLWETIALIGALILAGGGGLAVAWRQQQVRFYRASYQASEALRDSEQKYQLLFEQLFSGLAVHEIVCSPDGKPVNYRFLSVNSAFEKLTGLSSAAILGKTVLEVMPGTEPGWIERYGKVALTGQPAHFEDYAGELDKYFEVRAFSPERGKFATLFNDITERKQTEKALRKQNEYLAALQETTLELLSQMDPGALLENIVRRAGLLMGTSSGFLDLVEPETGLLKPQVGIGLMAESLKVQVALGEGISGIVWQTGQPLAVNDYDHWAGRIAGFSPGTVSAVIGVPLLYGGKVLGVLGLGHDFATRRTFEAGDVEILTQFARLAVIAIENVRLLSVAKQELAERKQQETQLLAAQAELQELLVKADQSRRALLTVVEDQKLAEEEILRLNAGLEQRVAERTAQLEVSNKELEAFAYSVSHDLRAPLRAIDGFSRILQQEYAQKLDEEGLRLLGVVRKSTGMMDHLITDLLALSRVGRSELRYSPIDMATMANSIYHELATPEVLEEFVFKVADLPRASGDPTLMRQVWTNLISNAIKYTLPNAAGPADLGGVVDPDVLVGKKECVIEINGWAKDGLCTYSIKDNGVGFNPKYTDKLFGLFQRLHKAGEFEGTGVGLAIVQRIIHRHGGQAWGEGQVGAGATFYFAIPERQENHESS